LILPGKGWLLLLFTEYETISDEKQRGIMALYNFTLTLSGVTYETEGLEDALY